MITKAKEKLYVAIIIILIGITAQSYFSFKLTPSREVEVYYNQTHGLNTEIINTIRDADEFVYFAIYTFTRQDIADALLAAKYRGVKIVGLTDQSQYEKIDTQRKIINKLRNENIPIFVQDHSAIMHLKVIVTEKSYISGSYNWTSAATNLNDEVIEIGTDQKIRRKYEAILNDLFKKYGKS